MPVINKDPKRMGNVVVTEFVDSVGTSPITFTLQNADPPQETLQLFNIGPYDLKVSVGTQLNITVPSYRGVTITENYTSFTIQSTFGVGGFRASCSYDDSPEEEEQALALRVTTVESSLASKAQQSETAKEFAPIKGITLYLGDPSYTPTQATIDTSINNIKNAGFTDVFILVYANQTDGNTGTTIVQSTADSFITTNIQNCQNAGLNVKAIKFHLGGISSSTSLNPSNVTTWFTNYKTVLMHVATLCQSYGVEYFVISNERTDMTQLSSNVASWQDIINSVKALGYKTMCNCTHDEAYQSKILSYVDAIGINMYPHMSNKGVNATLEECIQAWRHDIAGREWIALIDYMKSTYNKPVFISETGCPPYPTSLANPEDWTVTGTADYTNIQNKFYLATLYVLGTYSNLDGMFIWESVTSKYNPFNEPVNTTLKQFFGVVQS